MNKFIFGCILLVIAYVLFLDAAIVKSFLITIFCWGGVLFICRAGAKGLFKAAVDK